MSFPKKGKSFPGRAERRSNMGNRKDLDAIDFVGEIAVALNRTLQDQDARIKTVASWTGANERTVKNWISGRYGPCGSHLIVLMRHSNEVVEAVLSMAGLNDLRLAEKLTEMERHMQELISIIKALNRTAEP